MYRIVDIRNGMYGVLDTKDGHIDYVTGMEIVRADSMGIKVQGCRWSNGQYYLSIYRPKRRKRVG